MKRLGWLLLVPIACADPPELSREEDSGVAADSGVVIIPQDTGVRMDAAPSDTGIHDAGAITDATPVDADPIDAAFDDATFPDAEILDADPPDTGTSSTTWNPATVTATVGQETPCTNSGFVRWSPPYQKWIAVSLCTATRYKIFLGEAQGGPFYSIGDFAGNGQDHCELVNPAFTIPNEDDITSGGCTTCALGPYINPVGTIGYSRARFGEQFTFQPVWPMFNLYTPTWYECGIALP
jgi:hypothetical protein